MEAHVERAFFCHFSNYHLRSFLWVLEISKVPYTITKCLLEGKNIISTFRSTSFYRTRKSCPFLPCNVAQKKRAGNSNSVKNCVLENCSNIFSPLKYDQHNKNDSTNAKNFHCLKFLGCFILVESVSSGQLLINKT